MELPTGFRPAERAQNSLLAAPERKALLWMARRLPAWVNSDHLTALGFLSLLGVGLSYWYSRYSRAGLILAIVFFALNWFGDSLDGTLARVRNQQRPRYGFYADHILDACGSVFVFAGIALAGYMSERIAVGLLVAYLLLSIEAYLATYTMGNFRLSFGWFGPTELRLLLIAGNVALLRKPFVTLAGHQYLLFDVGGAIGIAGMLLALIWSISRHGAHLYRAETRPRPVRLKVREMLARWGKFNVVGVAGFAVQLALLWIFTTVSGMHYLIATMLAVEIAVLHNFVLHEAWTWRNLQPAGRWQRLLRFHLANGLISIVSSVLFTWFLKEFFGLPLLVSNAAAVGVTALLNFAMAEAWVFRPVTAAER